MNSTFQWQPYFTVIFFFEQFKRGRQVSSRLLWLPYSSDVKCSYLAGKVPKVMN